MACKSTLNGWESKKSACFHQWKIVPLLDIGFLFWTRKSNDWMNLKRYYGIAFIGHFTLWKTVLKLYLIVWLNQYCFCYSTNTKFVVWLREWYMKCSLTIVFQNYYLTEILNFPTHFRFLWYIFFGVDRRSYSVKFVIQISDVPAPRELTMLNVLS